MSIELGNREKERKEKNQFFSQKKQCSKSSWENGEAENRGNVDLEHFAKEEFLSTNEVHFFFLV